MTADLHNEIARTRERLKLSALEISAKRAHPSGSVATSPFRIAIAPDGGLDSAVEAASCDFYGDLAGSSFYRQAQIRLPAFRGANGTLSMPAGASDLMINVQSSFFPAHHDWAYEVRASLDGRTIGKHLFQGWYAQHQFFIPLPRLENTGIVYIEASPVRAGECADVPPQFNLEVFLTSKDALESKIEEGAIWLFSTARSGSTWLAADLLCANERARLMDEPGLGRMFAPLQLEPERLFDLGTPWRSWYSESGFDYETGQKPRAYTDRFPPFERAFYNMRRENQILREQNFDFYHKALRDFAIGHIINEWGCRDFSRVVLKCPNEGHAADFIMRAFPKSHMVFLMRDGRDVMRSRFSPFASPLLAETADKDLRSYAIAFYSHWWNFQVDIIQSAFDNHDSSKRYFLKYEDIRTSTKSQISALFEHLGILVTPAAIEHLVTSTALEVVPEAERGPNKPRQTGNISGYSTTFTTEEIDLMNTIMGPTLGRYGYNNG